MNYLSFRNNSTLSLMDLTTMGDSCKKNDESKIGQFSTGLKYAIAILLREGIKFHIETNIIEDSYHGYKRWDFHIEPIEKDRKTKNLIIIEEFYEILSAKLDGTFVEQKFETAFSSDLGYQWNLWMAIRELWSNCLDENGHKEIRTSYEPNRKGTTIWIELDEKIQNILNQWNHYFLSDEITSLGQENSSEVDAEHQLKVLKIPENSPKTLKVFKQGFLVYEENIKSNYWYNIHWGELDEKRQLLNFPDEKYNIKKNLFYHEKDRLIEFFKISDFEDTFENTFDFECTSVNFKDVIKELHNSGELSKMNLPEKIKKELGAINGLDLGYKSIRVNFGDPWYYGTLVEEVETKEEYVKSFEEILVNKIFSFNLELGEYTIKPSKIKSYKVLANSNKKELYITEDFNIEKDSWELLKACFRMKFGDDQNEMFKFLIENIYK